jgi:hypothetical protein
MPQPFFNPQSFNAGALVASFIPGGKIRLFSIAAYNKNASTRYLQLHDSAGVPANGAVPLVNIPIATLAGLSPPLSFGDVGLLFAKGICIAASTTDTTLTLSGTSDFLLDVVAS